MDIVVTGRHCEVSDGFRAHVEEKLARLEKHDHRIIRVAVEVSAERNPRQADRGVRVQLTAFSKGPVVRAEAAADHKMGALDLAIDKMAAQMRRASDRRRVHRGRHAPMSVSRALADTAPLTAPESLTGPGSDTESDVRQVGSVQVEGDGPFVMREKVHAAAPMTLDQALYEMELVGHDFFLFVDATSGRPSVVYRRRGYDYGVIALDVAQASAEADAGGAAVGNSNGVASATPADLAALAQADA